VRRYHSKYFFITIERMDNESETRPALAAEHIERLKRDYIESTLILAESFARQAARYAEEGDEQATLEAEINLESFCHLARDMIHKLHDGKSAEWFLARLRQIGCDPEDSENAA
jgi:hypothetical protein